MAADYRGGFAICPACACAVADDRIDLHDDWHRDQPTGSELQAFRDAVTPQNPLKVREWPGDAPNAPTPPPEAAPEAFDPEPKGFELPADAEDGDDRPFSRY